MIKRFKFTILTALLLFGAFFIGSLFLFFSEIASYLFSIDRELAFIIIMVLLIFVFTIFLDFSISREKKNDDN